MLGGGEGVFIRPFVNFAVALFVFLSGYLTKDKIDNVIIFYKKRILRVLIPYIFWSVLHTIISGSFTDLPRNLLTAQANSIYYYVLLYIQLVILTPCIGKLLVSHFAWIGWIITPVSLLVLRYIPAFLRISVQFPLNESCCLLWFAYYYLGMGLGNGIFKVEWNKKLILIGYSVLLVMAEIEGYIWFLNGNYDMATTQLRFTSLLSSTAFCLFAYSFIADADWKVKGNMITKVLLKLGDCSFGIYLSHVAVMTVLNKIPGYNLVVFPFTSIVVLWVSLICVMIGNELLGDKIGRYFGLN